MTFGLILFSISSYLIVIIDNLLYLKLIFFISGFVSGMIDVILQNGIILIHQDKVDPWMQALYFFYGLGLFFGTSLESLIYLDAYIVFSVMSLITAIFVFFTESPQVKNSIKENFN